MYWNTVAQNLQSGLIGLTLTWDVLKSSKLLCTTKRHIWLTLTWDVLKFANIEGNKVCGFWLTLTWDVLKSSPNCYFAKCF